MPGSQTSSSFASNISKWYHCQISLEIQVLSLYPDSPCPPIPSEALPWLQFITYLWPIECLLCQCSHTAVHSVHRTILQSRSYYYPYFIDVGFEAQEGWVVLPRLWVTKLAYKPWQPGFYLLAYNNNAYCILICLVVLLSPPPHPRD
jgi:hypothetical protein